MLASGFSCALKHLHIPSMKWGGVYPYGLFTSAHTLLIPASLSRACCCWGSSAGLSVRHPVALGKWFCGTFLCTQYSILFWKKPTNHHQQKEPKLNVTLAFNCFIVFSYSHILFRQPVWCCCRHGQRWVKETSFHLLLTWLTWALTLNPYLSLAERKKNS